ncbi:MAG: pyridoxine 5'-phosphate synthase [Verrucomicrobiota bacterium]|nr:pyridoxine 5'-phosphate synthase [Verrucomicrobiota bacterium]
MRTQPLLLGVNIDHCATLRQARYREFARDCGQMVEPDPLALAMLAERAGADGITVHLREDRRHIQDGDVRRMRESIQTRLNLEMACTPDMLAYALTLQPDSVCLVPENRQEVTTEGGLGVVEQRERVGEIIKALNGAGIMVSLFIDPDTAQIETAAELCAGMVELHTGSFARHYYLPKTREEEVERLRAGAELGHRLGLIVNAGHGINYVNIADIRRLPHLHELNIGHSILSRALFTGIEEAVREMKTRMNEV